MDIWEKNCVFNCNFSRHLCCSNIAQALSVLSCSNHLKDKNVSRLAFVLKLRISVLHFKTSCLIMGKFGLLSHRSGGWGSQKMFRITRPPHLCEFFSRLLNIFKIGVRPQGLLMVPPSPKTWILEGYELETHSNILVLMFQRYCPNRRSIAGTSGEHESLDNGCRNIPSDGGDRRS